MRALLLLLAVFALPTVAAAQDPAVAVFVELRGGVSTVDLGDLDDVAAAYADRLPAPLPDRFGSTPIPSIDAFESGATFGAAIGGTWSGGWTTSIGIERLGLEESASSTSFTGTGRLEVDAPAWTAVLRVGRAVAWRPLGLRIRPTLEAGLLFPRVAVRLQTDTESVDETLDPMGTVLGGGVQFEGRIAPSIAPFAAVAWRRAVAQTDAGEDLDAIELDYSGVELVLGIRLGPQP